jgi:hypothetical protein
MFKRIGPVGSALLLGLSFPTHAQDARRVEAAMPEVTKRSYDIDTHKGSNSNSEVARSIDGSNTAGI